MINTLASVLFLTTLALASVVSYDGFRAVRVPTEGNAARVAEMVERLGLDTWKHTASFADVIVPPEKLDGFRGEVAGLDVELMHEDLGASAALEKRSRSGMSPPPPRGDSGEMPLAAPRHPWRRGRMLFDRPLVVARLDRSGQPGAGSSRQRWWKSRARRLVRCVPPVR